MRVLISGGAGFVGSNLALSFKQQYPSATVVAFDNLKRRGAELNLALFKRSDIEFVHGDVRIKDDLDDLNGNFDLFVEASAEAGSTILRATSCKQIWLELLTASSLLDCARPT
jgi:CDP-paratose 2-epimerase